MTMNQAPQRTERPERKPQKQQPKPKLHDLRFHMQIAEHDKQVKLNQAVKFLQKRELVRITLQLRCRERGREDSALKFMGELVAALAEHGAPSTPKPTASPNISYTLQPLRIKR